MEIRVSLTQLGLINLTIIKKNTLNLLLKSREGKRWKERNKRKREETRKLKGEKGDVREEGKWREEGVREKVTKWQEKEREESEEKRGTVTK